MSKLVGISISMKFGNFKFPVFPFFCEINKVFNNQQKFLRFYLRNCFFYYFCELKYVLCIGSIIKSHKQHIIR